MKINDYRDQQGKFAKRKKVKRNRFIVLILIILATIIVIKSYNTSQTLKTAPETTFNKKEDICAGNELCRLKIENLAAQTLLQAEIKKVREEYETKLTTLEGQLAEKKAEELSLK